MVGKGYDVLTGGTDNHMFLINASGSREDLTGIIAQKALEDCGIIINMNRLPYDRRSASVTSGVRIGTPIVTRNGMGEPEMETISGLIDGVLRSLVIEGDTQYRMDETVKSATKAKVRELCEHFPMW